MYKHVNIIILKKNYKKITFKLCIITLLLSSCIHTTKDKVNNILTNCLIESYKAKDVDIITELNNFENYLIKKGRIESSTGQ